MQSAVGKVSAKAALAIVAAAVGALIGVGLQPVVISSHSMAPTLDDGQLVFMLSRDSVLERRVPGRGDIVVVQSPTTHGRAVKRIVAVAGDNVRIVQGTLHLNGAARFEPYVSHGTAYLRGQDTWPPTGDGEGMRDIAVPAGAVFLLGDNRSDSNDSRYWGALPSSSVVGRVVFPVR